MNIITSILMTIPIIGISIYDTILDIRNKKNIQTLILNIFLWLIIIFSSFLSYYAFQINVYYGIAQYLFPLMLSICVLFYDFNANREMKRFEAILFGFILIVNLIMFIWIIPIGLLPNLRVMDNKLAVTQSISPDPIVNNLSQIQQSIGTVEDQLKEQSDNIDYLSKSLVQEIEKKNDDLKKINDERNKLESDIAYYDSLASLSKDQADSIINALNRSKYIDYIFGFIIGIITSGIFYFLPRLTRRKKSKENSNLPVNK
jgi:hypothetical protein